MILGNCFATMTANFQLPKTGLSCSIVFVAAKEITSVAPWNASTKEVRYLRQKIKMVAVPKLRLNVKIKQDLIENRKPGKTKVKSGERKRTEKNQKITQKSNTLNLGGWEKIVPWVGF